MRLSVGLGCDRGVSLATLSECLRQALASQGLAQHDVAVLASILAKSDEPALLELAGVLQLPLRFFNAAALAAVSVPNPSPTVLRHMGTPSVGEAAALLAAGANVQALLVEKHRWRGADGRHATVSIARMNSNE